MQRGAGRAAGEVAAALQRGETSAERERGAQPDDVLDAECERIGGSAIAGEGGAALAEDIEVAIDLVVTAGERGASEDAMFRAGEVQAMTEGGVAGEDLGVEVSFAGGLELVEIVVNLLPRQTDGDVAVSGGRDQLGGDARDGSGTPWLVAKHGGRDGVRLRAGGIEGQRPGHVVVGHRAIDGDLELGSRGDRPVRRQLDGRALLAAA